MKTRLSRHVLFTVFVFSYLLFSLVAIHAQQAQAPVPAPTVAPTPNPREVLISEIKNLAQRHVDNDAGLKTELAIELYKDNTVGLPSSEIAKIYDEEYARLKKAKKPTIWEQFQPKIEWIVLIIVFLLGVLVSVVKEWITKLYNMVGNWLYKRFAGSRLLRGRALRHYCKALFDKYEKLVIPFRPNRPLDMREVYVPLKVAGTQESEQIEAQTAITQHHRLMVVGQPGSGKSMLCKNLAFAYSENRLDLPDAPIPILLELHRLNDANLSIEEQLAKEFDRNDFLHAKHFVTQSLKKGTLMLLLDGLDEINSNEREGVVRAIKDLLDKHRNCRVLITCRTAVYNNEFAETVDQTLEIVDFSDQQIRRFLKSWEKDMSPEKSIEQLMHTLRDRPRILSLARNPLLLTIIAYLYTDTPYVLPHSRAEFYRKATDQLLNEWHIERNRFEFRDKKAILQHLALFNQGVAAQHQEDRRSIEYRTVVEQVQQILPKINLQAEQVDDILDEIVERSGLLLSIDGGERYQFAHLTLQEFLAAEELLNNAQGLIDRFCKDPNAWRETVKLWCGLAPDSVSLIRTIYKEDSMTAFECLADAKKIEPSLATEIIEEFKRRLDPDDNDIDAIVRAFGAVASDLRPRGKIVLEFLQNTLENPISQDQFLAAAAALSYTNLPQAAEVLIKYYKTKPEIREILIRMGDIVVQVLKPLAEKGDADAMDDLLAIGTPQATEVLVPLLWHNEQKTAYKASWRLVALLPRPNVENVLRNYLLTDEQRKTEWLDWIWKPFNEPENSAIPVIAGRVAYLIEQAPMETTPENPPSLDLRLIIPLSSIGSEIKIEIPDELKDKGKEELLETDEKKQIQFIKKILDKSNISEREQYLLATIGTRTRLKLLYHMSQKQLTQNDWINIFYPVKHDINKSWHLRTVFMLVAVMSIIALISAVFTIQSSHPGLRLLGYIICGEIILFLFLPIILKRSDDNLVITLLLFCAPFWLPSLSLSFKYGYLSAKYGDDEFFMGLFFMDFVFFNLPVMVFASELLLCFLTQLTVVTIWVVWAGTCTLLLWQSYRLEQAARNPLQGILEPPSRQAKFVPFYFYLRWFRLFSKRRGK